MHTRQEVEAKDVLPVRMCRKERTQVVGANLGKLTHAPCVGRHACRLRYLRHGFVACLELRQVPAFWCDGHRRLARVLYFMCDLGLCPRRLASGVEVLHHHVDADLRRQTKTAEVPGDVESPRMSSFP